MAVISSRDMYKSIVRDIDTGNVKRLYFLYGSEKQFLKKSAEKLLKELVPEDFAAFNLHRFDGKDLDFEALNFAKETLPVFNSYTLLYIKDCPVDSLNGDECTALTELVADIPETTVILFSLPSTSCDFKNESQKDLLKVLKSVGSVYCFGELSDSDLKEAVIKRCRQNGKSISTYDASYLVRLSGSNSEKLMNEVDKICFYSENTSVTSKEIDEMTEKSVDAVSYKISDFILRRMPDDAFEMLDECFKKHLDPILIFGGMSKTFTNLFIVSVYTSAGKGLSELNTDFSIKESTYGVVKKYCGRFSLSQLRSFLNLLGSADISLKTASNDSRIVLETLITGLCLTVNGE